MVVDKNRLDRESHSLRKENAQHVRTIEALRAQLKRTEGDLAKHRSEARKHEELKKELNAAQAELADLRCWRSRVKDRGDPEFLSQLEWLGRPYSRAKDRSWGGGN